ncbi:MAG: hypothetical protein KF730_02945 [Sphingomonas sp.]|uniref:acyl-CoA dehydrogenase family protein n=1 Tax=Sphingomonas sp. TaxID=28214 RepID=UPI0025FE814A|nr:acyl-CoA dehydrogenase [Sphingomonas sp.]MBX3563513.1 hypothetical protein [Sphingomonas sp.]
MLSDDEIASAVLDGFGGFLDEHHDLARRRRVRETAPGYSPALWRRFAAEGWLGSRAGEREGGSGLSAHAAGGIAQLVGERLVPEPYLAQGLFPLITLLHADEGASRASAMEGLLGGQSRIAVAWQERPGAVEIAGNLRTRLSKEGGRWRLDGEKTFVVGGGAAERLIVLAADGAGTPHLLLIPSDAEGVRIADQRQIDGTTAATICFSSAPVADDMWLQTGSASALDGALTEVRAMLAMQLLGIARAALAITIEHAKTRQQFGKPIGSFQAIQHRLVDYAMRIRLSEALCVKALKAVDGDDADRAKSLAAAAKLSAAEAALVVTRGGIHLHGALGYTDDADIGLYHVAALVLAPWLGNTEALTVHLLNLNELAA